MQIHLHRHRINEIACDGTLTIDDTRICDTAENARYRVPAGTYRIALRYSSIHSRKVPVLVEKPSVCLAIGNGIWNRTDGRILTGTRIAPGCVKQSREPFMQLYNRINASLRRHHEVTIKITEDST